ncbi:unnamed protein product [Caenorhabditis brenneri]
MLWHGGMIPGFNNGRIWNGTWETQPYVGPVKLISNLREIVLPPEKTIFVYDIKVDYVFETVVPAEDGSKERVISVSNSSRKNKKLAQDKRRCRIVYNKVIKEILNFENDDGIFYNNQGTLCTFQMLKMSKLSLVLEDNSICKHPTFLRVDFSLEKSKKQFQYTVKDLKNISCKTPPEGQNYMSVWNTIMYGIADNSSKTFSTEDGNRYLKSSDSIGLQSTEHQEGMLSSAVGMKSSLLALEGSTKTPHLYLAPEIQYDMFHPEYTTVAEIMESFHGFVPNLHMNSEIGKRIANSLNGLDIVLNYGRYANMQEDRVIMTITGFTDSPKNKIYKNRISHYQRFIAEYDLKLKYPDLMMISTTNDEGEGCFFPPEVVTLASYQRKTYWKVQKNDPLRKLQIETPDLSIEKTDTLFKAVYPESKTSNSFFSISTPVQLDGYVLKAPNMLYRGPERLLCLPTLMNNWVMIFVQGEELPTFGRYLGDQFRVHTKVSNDPPWVSYTGNLEFTFQAQRGRQIAVIVTKKEYNLHNTIRNLERKHDVPCYEITYEYAKKILDQNLPCSKIVNEINAKLGGLNFILDDGLYDLQRRLIIGISIKKESLTTIGVSANIQLRNTGMEERRPIFASSYKYVESASSTEFKEIFLKTVEAFIKNIPYAPPEKIVVYFSGISENELHIVDEYAKCGLDSLVFGGRKISPKAYFIVVSENHPIQCYQTYGDKVTNLANSTVIDQTLAPSLPGEFFLFNGNGALNPTKYTVIYSHKPPVIRNLECLTNSLCHAHQTGTNPINIPSPLKIAENAAKRGAKYLNYRKGPKMRNGVVDLYATNRAHGYGQDLFDARRDFYIDY